jgi:hypothetical protein
VRNAATLGDDISCKGVVLFAIRDAQRILLVEVVYLEA